MTSRGRPRLVSPDMLTEAATELFLEKGYHHTSVDDIAHRAGVSRATFFNYFPTKADVLFSPIDRILDTIEHAISDGTEPLEAIIHSVAPVTRMDLPLIATQADAMDAGSDVARVGPSRVERLRTLIAMSHPHPFDNWVLAAALAQAAITWATDNPSASMLTDTPPDTQPRTLMTAIAEVVMRVEPILNTPTNRMH